MLAQFALANGTVALTFFEERVRLKVASGSLIHRVRTSGQTTECLIGWSPTRARHPWDQINPWDQTSTKTGTQNPNVAAPICELGAMGG